MTALIEKLNLSARAANTLRNMGGIERMEDFMALTREKVTREPNAGMHTWTEIHDRQKLLQAVAVRTYEDPCRVTRRDRFAIEALTTLEGEHRPDAAARRAYEYADAMERAREGRSDEV